MLPKDRYIVIWTNQRRLADGTLESYENQAAMQDFDKAKETFEVIKNERLVKITPCWLIDLHSANIIKTKE